MAEKNNVVLIGMPGAGKSSLGVVCAKLLGLDFLDADLLIQSTHGKKLWELIEEHGVEGFVELENRILASLDCEHTLIATGGSAVYGREAMEHLRSLGIVVYLKVPVEELAKRIGEIHDRGVVVRPGVSKSLSGILADRGPLYEKYADIVLDTAGMGAREAAEALYAALA